MLKRLVKTGGPLRGDGSTTPPTKPSDLLKGAPSLYTGMRLPNAVQSK